MAWERLGTEEKRRRVLSWLDSVDRRDVLTAIAIYQGLGRRLVRAVYGFRQHRNFAVEHNGALYPCRALLGIAHQLAHGVALTPRDCGPLEDCGDHVRRRFRHLGFTVI